MGFSEKGGPLFRDLGFFWNLLNALKQRAFWWNNSEITAAEQHDNSKFISDILATVPLRGRNAHKPVAPTQKRMLVASIRISQRAFW